MTVKVITRSLAVLHWCNQITRQGFIKIGLKNNNSQNTKTDEFDRFEDLDGKEQG